MASNQLKKTGNFSASTQQGQIFNLERIFIDNLTAFRFADMDCPRRKQTVWWAFASDQTNSLNVGKDLQMQEEQPQNIFCIWIFLTVSVDPDGNVGFVVSNGPDFLIDGQTFRLGQFSKVVPAYGQPFQAQNMVERVGSLFPTNPSATLWANEGHGRSHQPFIPKKDNNSGHF